MSHLPYVLVPAHIMSAPPAGPKDVRVHLVDSESRELVYALIVAAEAQGPLVTRCAGLWPQLGCVTLS